jgi:restriction endonuclease S subunit
MVERFKTNFKIPIPSLEIQSEIVERIKLLEDKSSHYNVYADILKTELKNISDMIDNIL